MLFPIPVPPTTKPQAVKLNALFDEFPLNFIYSITYFICDESSLPH